MVLDFSKVPLRSRSIASSAVMPVCRVACWRHSLGLGEQDSVERLNEQEVMVLPHFLQLCQDVDWISRSEEVESIG